MPEVPVPQSHLFETTEIRSVWDDEQEEWYFSVVDVVAVLTESLNPTDYLKKLRKRDALLGDYLGTNCPQVVMKTSTGKLRKTLAATTEQLLRIIQSIPSKKAEPFKLWLAQAGSERLDQLQDPELSIEQAMRDYKTLGYSDNWINQRLKSIEIRKQLVCSVLEHTTEHGAIAGKTQIRALKYYNLENIFDSDALEREATISILETVHREVKRKLEYYNLDAIIAVGYRAYSGYPIPYSNHTTQGQEH